MAKVGRSYKGLESHDSKPFLLAEAVEEDVSMKLPVLVAALPIPVIFFRTKPSEKGLLPLGAEMSDEEIAAAEKKSGHSLSEVNIAVGWKVLRKHAGFWLLVSGFLFVGVINGAVSVNMVSNMTSVNSNGTEVVIGGHSVVWAGYVTCGQSGIGVDFRPIRHYRRCARAPACWHVFSCASQQPLGGPILAAACFGVGTCTATIGPSIMISREYGRRDVGKLTGIAVSATALGGIIGAIVSGVAFDATLSFAPAWIIGAVCSVLMAVSLIASYVMSGKLVARCAAEGAPRIDAEGNIIEE